MSNNPYLENSEHWDKIRIISIDPGEHLGVSVWEYNTTTKERHLQCTFALDSRFAKKYDWMKGQYTDRAIMQYAYKNMFVKLFGRVWPHYVICESNFAGRFPQAYAGLVEIVGCSVRAAILEFDSTIGLEMVDPISAKVAVGAPSKGGDKNEVKKRVGKLDNVIYDLEANIDDLSFDACDSIALGYAFFNRLETAWNIN